MENYIMDFSAIRLGNIPEVGGKNASLGEMTGTLFHEGIIIPAGFALTTAAFRAFMTANQLWNCFDLLHQLDRKDFSNLHQLGTGIRGRMLSGILPPAVADQLRAAYRRLGSGRAVAVRSSATAEDLPSAILTGIYSEEDHACKKMIEQMITAANNAGVPVGFCGQAPSDIPGYAAFLVENGITSISFNPDAFFQGQQKVYEAEQEKLSPAGVRAQ